MARTLTLDPHAPEGGAIAEAARVLQAGGLVAFPTETVYGLGANALDAAAVAKIYLAKGRPAANPLIVHVADADMARQVVAAWPAAAQRLAEACWPGPLTLVLPRGPAVPASVTAGLPAVGVRVPAHPVALALIRAAGVPVAAPSANPYTGVSPTTAAHVAAGLGDRVELILDGGPAAVGVESTVLDLTGRVPRVLRPGGLPIPRLRELLGEVIYVPITKADDVALPSPGLAKRHYAPRAKVMVLPDAAAVARAAAGLADVGCWTFGPPPGEGEQMPANPEAYAARLYAGLHEADRRGWKHLLIEAPPRDEAWAAVHDRLKRAASS